MAVTVDLITESDAEPTMKRVDADCTEEERAERMEYSGRYFKCLFEELPEYKAVVRASKHARHLWFALRNWRGEGPEGLFGRPEEWAGGILSDAQDFGFASKPKIGDRAEVMGGIV